MKSKKLLFQIGAAVVALIFLIVAIPKFLASREKEEKKLALVEEASDSLEKAKTQSSKNVERDMYRKAVHSGEEALALDPQYLPAHLVVARAHFALGNYSQAASAYAHYLEHSEAENDVLREAGVAWVEKWKLSRNASDRIQAQNYFESVLSSQSGDASALFYLGLIWFEEKDFDKSGQFWNKLYSIAPNSQEADKARALQAKR